MELLKRKVDKCLSEWFDAYSSDARSQRLRGLVQNLLQKVSNYSTVFAVKDNMFS